MKKNCTLNILLLTLLISCDYPNQIHYTVANKTKDSLVLKFTYRTIFLGNEIKDTAVVVLENQEDTLFTLGMTSSIVFNPELADTMNHIYGIDLVRLSDHVRIKKDIQQKKNWEYIKKGRNIAVLKLIVNDPDF
jgi:hypothetical protein